MDNFASKFWRQVKQDRSVSDVMNKIGTARQDRVVRLLEVISEPGFEKKFRWNVQLNRAKAPPTHRKELRRLARRLRTIARDLEQEWGAHGNAYKREQFIKLSADCSLRAKDLKYLDWAYQIEPPRRYKMPTYKSFWKHLPLAILGHEFEASNIDWAQGEALLRCAYSLRGSRWSRPKRSVEREYKRFMGPAARRQALKKLFAMATK